jgi:hypothetical protein
VPGARLAEELRLLLDLLADRLQPWLDRMAAEHQEHEAAGQRPVSCDWCPFCAGLAVLRGERPELAVRAAEHAAGLLAVLRAVLAEGTSAAAPAQSAAQSPTAGQSTTDWSTSNSSTSNSSTSDSPVDSPTSDSPRVQRITVRRPGDSGDRT